MRIRDGRRSRAAREKREMLVGRRSQQRSSIPPQLRSQSGDADVLAGLYKTAGGLQTVRLGQLDGV